MFYIALLTLLKNRWNMLEKYIKSHSRVRAWYSMFVERNPDTKGCAMFNINNLESFVNSNNEKVYRFTSKIILPSWWYNKNFGANAWAFVLAVSEGKAVITKTTQKAILVSYSVDTNTMGYYAGKVWIAKSIITMK